MGKNILIIKLGAAGDVLRTTSILNGLSKIDPAIKEVTWITAKENIPIIHYTSKVDSMIEKSCVNGILKNHYDYAVNFDEDLEACDMLSLVNSPNKFGYINNGGKYSPVNSLSDYAYQLSKDDNLKFRKNKKTYQQIIFEMCGIEWSGEDYDFNYKKSGKEYIALNHEVGVKWPTKKWQDWTNLKTLLDNQNMHYEEQKLFDNLIDYFDWISKARIVITSDTLGMHLALAMKKPTIAFFGPTSYTEIEGYGLLRKLYDEDLDCLVCYKSNCPFDKECMTNTDPDYVLKETNYMIDNMEEV